MGIVFDIEHAPEAAVFISLKHHWFVRRNFSTVLEGFSVQQNSHRRREGLAIESRDIEVDFPVGCLGSRCVVRVDKPRSFNLVEVQEWLAESDQ